MPDPLSPQFLATRGYCCGNVCTNCPYKPRHTKDNKELDQKFKTFWEEHSDAVYAFEEYSKKK